MNRRSLKVVVASNDALWSEILDGLPIDESGYDVVVVASIPDAYSRIRQIQPDLVVVFMEVDDVNACQLLSMLAMDGAVRGIPVVTCATGPEPAAAYLLRVFAHQSQPSAGATLRQ